MTKTTKITNIQEAGFETNKLELLKVSYELLIGNYFLNFSIAAYFMQEEPFDFELRIYFYVLSLFEYWSLFFLNFYMIFYMDFLPS